MALKLIRKRRRTITIGFDKPVEVLKFSMMAYHKEHKEILQRLVQELKKESINSPALKAVYQLMDKCAQNAIDCAAKLAPYIHPKLESMEIKQSIEHRMVMRSPRMVNTIEEWAKLTGAGTMKIEDKRNEIVDIKPIEPSIHDFDTFGDTTDDNIEDEINTFKTIN